MRNVRQLLSMIEDLLEDTRVRGSSLKIAAQTTSIGAAIEYAVQTLLGAGQRKGVTLSWEATPGLPLIYADSMRLRQVLTILLDNAVKFTPSGGSARVAVRLQEGSEMLRVEVTDTGPGIPPDSLQRVFGRLYQATDPGEAGRRGLGLGLHIAKGLVELQGGEIGVESELGAGSRFYFTVPRFSLASVLKPVLPSVIADDAAFLVEMELTTNGEIPDLVAEVVELARTVLQSCLRPENDLLLPNLSGGRRGGAFPGTCALEASRRGSNVRADCSAACGERGVTIVWPGCQRSVSLARSPAETIN